MLPASTPFQSASLYIGDLHPDVTEGLLFELFNRVGPVASIRVCRDMVTRRSLGYAYVNFHNVQDAERALDTMNFTDIKGRPCRIMWSQRDPSLRKSGVGNVFVKNLAPTVDNKGLFDVFSVFGNILSCKIATDENGNSKGYGYVHYETGEAAEGAIAKLNGHLLEDKEIYVGYFLRRQDRVSQVKWTNLYVKQFPESWRESDLEAVFAPFGKISSSKLAYDETGKSKAFGFVDFADHEAAQQAIENLHGKRFDLEDGSSFELYVGRMQKKTERTRELRYRMESMKMDYVNKFQGMNLYVKNVDESISDEQFRELFNQFGVITSAHIMRDENGASKGFGFVCYGSPEEATRAMGGMNGYMLNQKPLFVALHQRKELRRAHLAASYNARGQGMPRFPMGQAPMPYMNMYVQGQPMPRQPFPGMMPANMMPRGPVPNYPPRGGYPVPQYGGPGMNPNQGFKRNPMQQNNQARRMPGPRGPASQPVRGMGMQGRGPAGGMKYPQQGRGQMMPPQGGPVMMAESGPLDHNTLALADPQTQKNMIGERLYPMIMSHQPQLAGKITGMLLEMDNAELLHLLESPEALSSKIDEALQVLAAHTQGGGQM